jgi:flagellar motility protein MotE (MotC chaperone)
MSRLEKLEQDIAKLSPEEFVELEQWFDAERNRKWDRQIEEDAQSGKLREVYEKLKSENQGQPNTPLDEFLDNEKLS